MLHKKNNLIPIFPKCIYIQDNICAEHLNIFEENTKKLKKQTVKNSLLNVNSSHSINSNIHKSQPFNILETEIIEHVKNFMLQYGYSGRRIKNAFIKSMWFNISDKGDFLFPHIHYGSLISGAFYIKTSPENVILFHDDHKNFYEDPENMNEFSQNIKAIECKPGRLILFHGDLMHSTPIQSMPGEKIVVSFNVVLENIKE